MDRVHTENGSCSSGDALQSLVDRENRVRINAAVFERIPPLPRDTLQSSIQNRSILSWPHPQPNNVINTSSSDLSLPSVITPYRPGYVPAQPSEFSRRDVPPPIPPFRGSSTTGTTEHNPILLPSSPTQAAFISQLRYAAQAPSSMSLVPHTQHSIIYDIPGPQSSSLRRPFLHEPDLSDMYPPPRQRSPKPNVPPTPALSTNHFPDKKALHTSLVATANFLHAQNIDYKVKDLCAYYSISLREGYYHLRKLRTHGVYFIPSRKDKRFPRGCHLTISKEQLRVIDAFIEKELWDGRGQERFENRLTWDKVRAACNVTIADNTFRRYMGTLNYSKCISCLIGYVSRSTGARRVKFAQKMLERFPTKENWRRVRFSDTVRYGFDDRGEARILKKPGERYCSECFREEMDVDTRWKFRRERRLHAWGAVGYNFISKLVIYDTEFEKNWTPEVYRSKILETEVASWLQRGDDFVLHEEGSIGTGIGIFTPGSGETNEVREWKIERDVDCYFNAEMSPDLAPIRRAFRLPRRAADVLGMPEWDTGSMEEWCRRGWEGLEQSVVNEWCDSMPDRLREVIACEGRMTPH